MTKRYVNSRKTQKISQISTYADLLSPTNDLTRRSKINFSYLDTSQSAGYDFKKLNANVLYDLLDKIKEHGKKSLEELQRTPVGGGSTTSNRGNILKIYNTFPPNNKTLFKEPTYTPHDVKWGTIRITGATRLAGFIIPPEYHGQQHKTTHERFDKNTFYVVFLDLDHKFWISSK